jgi:5-methylcytosine-specific restriction endonuclease McrA
VCGRPQPKAICDACKAVQDKARGPRQDRGYDAEYDRNRRFMIARAWANLERCVICGLGFGRMEDITAEHLIPLRNGGTSAPENLGPAHLRCNAGWRFKGGGG